MKEIIDLIRAMVRPYVTIVGFTGVLVLAILLALKFANETIALALITAITGAVTTALGFYFGSRQNPPHP